MFLEYRRNNEDQIRPIIFQYCHNITETEGGVRVEIKPDYLLSKLYEVFNAVLGDLAVNFRNNQSVRRLNGILKPNLNTRISVIIIHRRINDLSGPIIDNIVIFNPFAEKPLSRDFLDFSRPEFRTLEDYYEEIIIQQKEKHAIIQSLYKYGVLEKAQEYASNGWNVRAVFGEWEKPEPIQSYTPDIISKKDEDTHIIQISTYLSLTTRMDQLSFFKSYAERKPRHIFMESIVDPNQKIIKYYELEENLGKYQAED